MAEVVVEMRVACIKYRSRLEAPPAMTFRAVCHFLPYISLFVVRSCVCATLIVNGIDWVIFDLDM
jgi:hypothetical protein